MKTRKIVNALESVMNVVFTLCGLIAIAFVIIISVYLVIAGMPAIQEIGLWEFLSGTTWANTHTDEGQFGILPFILTSIYGTLGAIIIGVPIGFFASIYLAKVAPPKVAGAIRPAIDLLAGIPSVVYGLLGMIILVPFIRESFGLVAGDSLLAAIIVLAVMILPSIISVSETSLRAVPREFEEASLALGATELETYFKVSAPAARSGIAAAIVLGIGRAIGEAMAIMMVAGNAANMPSLFSSVRFLTTGIAHEMAYSAPGSLQRNALYSIGLVLFVFIMLINALLNYFLKRDKNK